MPRLRKPGRSIEPMPVAPIDTLERTTAAVRIHAEDNVAVALRRLEAGEQVDVAGRRLTLHDAIAEGHKFALDDIAAGVTVRRYGWAIGRATMSIPSGAHVHTHN